MDKTAFEGDTKENDEKGQAVTAGNAILPFVPSDQYLHQMGSQVLLHCHQSYILNWFLTERSGTDSYANPASNKDTKIYYNYLLSTLLKEILNSNRRSQSKRLRSSSQANPNCHWITPNLFRRAPL